LKFKQEIASLEAQFIELRKLHSKGGEKSMTLAELMIVPEIKLALTELSDRKKKA
jgi:hypothetical protein